MKEKPKCPECGETSWTDLKYVRNVAEFLAVEGRCLSCGYRIGAEFMLDSVRQKLPDFCVRTVGSRRDEHDPSLQGETLRDYPLYVGALEKALELCDRDEKEMRGHIRWLLSWLYEELGWYAADFQETLNYFNSSIFYPGVKAGDWASAEDNANHLLAGLLRRKSHLGWWKPKLPLLEKAYQLAKTVSYPCDEEEMASWGNSMGCIALDYGKEIGDDPRSRTIVREALDHFQLSVTSALQFSCEGDFLTKHYIWQAYQHMAEACEFLGDTQTAYAYARLAELAGGGMPKGGEMFAMIASHMRSSLEERLAEGPFALAKKNLEQITESFERWEREKAATKDSLSCDDRILGLLLELKKTLPSHLYRKLENYRRKEVVDSFTAVRRILEHHEKEIYRRLFGHSPIRLTPELVNKLLDELDSRAQCAAILARFVFKFASTGIHDSPDELAIEDLEQLFAGLARFMIWFQGFVRESDTAKSK